MARPFVSRRDLNSALLTAAFGFGLTAPLGLTVAVADRVLVWSLYGVDAARRHDLYVASHVPMRISNGDRIKEFKGFLHFVGSVGGWLVLAVVALFLIRRLLPKGYRRLVARAGGDPRGTNPDPARRRGSRWAVVAVLATAAVLLVYRQTLALAALSALAILCTHLVPLADEPPAPSPEPPAAE
jgi:hypothetical protein